MLDKIWDKASAAMDAAVDRLLGDTIFYATDGVTFTAVDGFVIDDVTGDDAPAAIDEMAQDRKRVKIAQAIVPVIQHSHRLRHARLGTRTFRPVGALPVSEGRYWLFDVQAV